MPPKRRQERAPEVPKEFQLKKVAERLHDLLGESEHLNLQGAAHWHAIEKLRQYDDDFYQVWLDFDPDQIVVGGDQRDYDENIKGGYYTIIESSPHHDEYWNYVNQFWSAVLAEAIVMNTDPFRWNKRRADRYAHKQYRLHLAEQAAAAEAKPDEKLYEDFQKMGGWDGKPQHTRSLLTSRQEQSVAKCPLCGNLAALHPEGWFHDHERDYGASKTMCAGSGQRPSEILADQDEARHDDYEQGFHD